MGSSSRKYGCEYMYTDIQLSDWCVCPRVCPNTYYFTTHISYEKEKCSQALALALEFGAHTFFNAVCRSRVNTSTPLNGLNESPPDAPRAINKHLLLCANHALCSTASASPLREGRATSSLHSSPELWAMRSPSR